jgi:hypothetical protein
MAMESVDLLSMLNRLRRPVEEVETAEKPEIAKQTPEPEVKPVIVAPAPIPESAASLSSLERELRDDDLMLQRILGLLYRAKKKNPNGGAVSILDIERALGLEREEGAFIMYYMKSLRLVQPDDKSRLLITVSGINYLRQVLKVNDVTIDVAEA